MTSRIAFLLLASITLSAQTTVSTSPMPTPATPKHEVTDDFFGTKIIDSYRWLENLNDDEMGRYKM